jgi:hypothetical protein
MTRLRSTYFDSNHLFIRPVGGIGNQFFSFFAGLLSANNQNICLAVDLSQVDSGVTAHSVSISDFSIVDSESTIIFSDCKVGSRALFVLSNLLQAIIGPEAQIHLTNHYSSTRNTDERVLASRLPIRFLRGHFICQRVLDFALDKGKKLSIDLRQPSRDFFRAMDLQQNTNPILLHVRRGDFERPNSKQRVLNLRYYFAALEELSASGRDVWIVTDSPSHPDVLELSREEGISLVNEIFPLTSAEEFTLLKNATEVVIANSTFSIMAAALGSPKIIIAPGYSDGSLPELSLPDSRSLSIKGMYS